MYETAGALGNGERVFITAKFVLTISVGNGDDVTESTFSVTTSHDGSGSITAAFTPIRIVCQNTLNASLREYDQCSPHQAHFWEQNNVSRTLTRLWTYNTLSKPIRGHFQ